MLDPYQRRLLQLPDGGTVALDFEDYDLPQDLPRDAPVVILLPGQHNWGLLCSLVNSLCGAVYDGDSATS